MEDKDVIEKENDIDIQDEHVSSDFSFVRGMILGMAIMLMLVLIVAGTVLYNYAIRGSKVVNYSVSAKMRMIENLIDKYYLNTDEITKQDIEDGIYKGMMEALGDPYSVYYDAEDFTELKESTSGTFEGVGMYLTKDKDTGLVKVVRPIADSPAMRAGVKADDIIYKINGEDIGGQDLTTVVAKVKGPKGSTVNIIIYRDGEEIEFNLVRETIKVSTVSANMIDDTVGYLQISEFDSVTYDQFYDALVDLESQNMQRLIIDLRGNPGGNVDAVCQISDQLLPKGLIVYTEDKNGKRKEYKSDAQHYFDKPLVVLVDGGSASASEILTGAIKDYGIGTIVGKTTYGKGIVQHIMSLGDGTGIKVTVEDYYTPSGNNIHKLGIDPDIEVDFDADAYLKDGTDTQLNKAIEIVKGIKQ